jgi:hypothetical protein
MGFRLQLDRYVNSLAQELQSVGKPHWRTRACEASFEEHLMAVALAQLAKRLQRSTSRRNEFAYSPDSLKALRELRNIYEHAGEPPRKGTKTSVDKLRKLAPRAKAGTVELGKDRIQFASEFDLADLGARLSMLETSLRRDLKWEPIV